MMFKRLKVEQSRIVNMCNKSTASTSSSATSSDEELHNVPARAGWDKGVEFIFSCISYAVGLGNLWRFPYLCYKNGGGAFLVPYLLFLILCGMPLVFLEFSYGQFSSCSPITAWRISPFFKGIGYGMVIISGIVCIYYNVIITWVLYFLVNSFRTTLPWATCDNEWNTDYCVFKKDRVNISVAENNYTTAAYTTVANITNQTIKWRTASEEYWENHVLQITDGIDNIGSIRWELFACLLACWVIVFGCLFKGIKSSGKVAYFTATFPYVVLVILLIRGVTLPGAIDGIKFYIIPDFTKLTTLSVWGEAVMQIFFSVGAAWGAMITMASYNKFNHNCYRDAVVIPLMNCGTSIFAGFAIFSIIGFMAHETGSPISDVVKPGPGLIFVVYPEAVARLPLSPLWAVLFFSMVFTVGIGSQFGMFETTTSAFVDEFPQYLSGKKKKILIVGVVCFLEFLIGIPCIMQGGMYVLQIMDWYSSTFALMIICLTECLVISWIYGLDRFYSDIDLMLGLRPNPWWKICWGFLTPILITLVFLYNVITHSPVKYDTYEYPKWSVGIGWILAIIPMIPMPVIAIIEMSKHKGSLFEKLRCAIRPAPEWGPRSQKYRDAYVSSLSKSEQQYVLTSLGSPKPLMDDPETAAHTGTTATIVYPTIREGDLA